METLTCKNIIQDPCYHQTRRRILERDNFKCSLCGDDSISLKIYIKDGKNHTPLSELPDESLSTLCNCCDTFVKINNRIHGFRPEIIKAVFIHVPNADKHVRLYRLGETILFYLFSSDGRIITSYQMKGSVELVEFFK